MGRRGQGQDRRSAHRAARYRRPLPGRRQRRAYRGHARRDLQAVARSQRHLPPRGAVRRRRRRRAQSGPLVRGDRRPGRARRRGRRESDDQLPRPRHLPRHFEEDRLLDDQSTGGETIGTTLRGIGPCYRDKVGRSLPFAWAISTARACASGSSRSSQAKTRSWPLGGQRDGRRSTRSDLRRVSWLCRAAAAHVADTTAYLLDAVEAGKRLLFEGARARCWTSTTAPFPLSPAATVGRGRVGRFGRARPLHHQGDRRASRHTARGSAADRSPPSRTTPPASTSASAATSTARSRGGRGVAAGSTPWPPAIRPGSAASISWR